MENVTSIKWFSKVLSHLSNFSQFVSSLHLVGLPRVLSIPLKIRTKWKVAMTWNTCLMVSLLLSWISDYQVTAGWLYFIATVTRVFVDAAPTSMKLTLPLAWRQVDYWSDDLFDSGHFWVINWAFFLPFPSFHLSMNWTQQTNLLRMLEAWSFFFRDWRRLFITIAVYTLTIDEL